MQGMLYLIIILASIIIILGMWLALYRKQMKHIKQELLMFEQEDTNYRLSSYCHIGETEDVIGLWNETLDTYRTQNIALQKENRSYKESITSISHDIRTPLTSAKGYTQMLLHDSIPDEKRNLYISRIEQRIDDVTNMLNQLFEYARVEAGELDFEYERINLNNLFTDTLSMFYDDFVAKNCEPVIEITETPCYVHADKAALVRIIENLIKNALVHGIKDYHFSLERKENLAVLSISNKNSDIEEKDIERIFERFYTTDQSRTRKTTGLGLAIVKRFTNQMGGNVKAYLQNDRFTIEVSFMCIKND